MLKYSQLCDPARQELAGYLRLLDWGQNTRRSVLWEAPTPTVPSETLLNKA